MCTALSRFIWQFSWLLNGDGIQFLRLRELAYYTNQWCRLNTTVAKFWIRVQCHCSSPELSKLSANNRSSQFISASFSTAHEARVPDRLSHNKRAWWICSRTFFGYCSASRSISASVMPRVRTRSRHFLRLTLSAMNLNSRISAKKIFQHINKLAPYATDGRLLLTANLKVTWHKNNDKKSKMRPWKL